MHDLAHQETTSALERRLRYYARPHLLCIDEVAAHAIDTRRLDLLYELVRRRYEAQRALVITSQLHESKWHLVMPSAAATASLTDRLVHRSLDIDIDADSYRRRHAEPRGASHT